MSHQLKTCLVLLAIAILGGSARALESERIDDRTVYDPSTGAFHAVSSPDREPQGPAVEATGVVDRGMNDGWIGCSTLDTCCPFDLDTYATGAALDLRPEGDYPYDATMKPDGSEVWFVGAVGDGAVVVDRATNTITHRIGTGEYPTSIAFSDDGALALVSCRDTENVTIIDTGTYAVTGYLPLPFGYDGGNIALDPVSKLFYLVDWYDNTLFEIAADGSAVLRQVDVGSSLWQLVVSPDGRFVYVTDRGADRVRVIDRATLTEIGTVPVGDDPWGIDVTADGGTLVVVCEDSHDVHIIDVATPSVTVLPLDPTADPRDVDILDASRRAFVCGGTVGSTSNPIYVIDLTDNTIETLFEANGGNTNVVAAQPQMHSGSSGVADGAADPSRLQLRAFPNPIVGRTELTYMLSEAGPVELAVFDLSGRRVRQLVDGQRDAGLHRLVWNAADGQMRPLADGVYFVRVIAGNERREVRVVIRR